MFYFVFIQVLYFIFTPTQHVTHIPQTCNILNIYNICYIYVYVMYIYVYGYFRLIPAQTGRFDLRYDSGYDSRVWIAARKTFISSIGRELSLEPKLYRPVHYQLN